MIVTRGLGPSPTLATAGVGPLWVFEVLRLAGFMTLADLSSASLALGDSDNGRFAVADR